MLSFRFDTGLALLDRRSRIPYSSPWLISQAVFFSSLLLAGPVAIAKTQVTLSEPAHFYFVDCSAPAAGDGSQGHPWSSLTEAQAHLFVPGEQIALKRGSICSGSFSPQGSGSEGHPIRLTAYGQGPRPQIVATPKDRQALLLFNQEYWQIDSLDLSGSSSYGIFVTGDKGTLHQITLKNLSVHDVRGGPMKNKDNGLVVVGPSARDALFDHILIDGILAAHSNQWAGILVGGGPFPYAPDAPLNTHILVRNSSVQDVYGDGIILFRDSDGVIETSAASETGMQTTQTVGTPNAIWTWTCTGCAVRDNEAYLTDSPGVDGGGYDIDWDNTRNTVERNYAHETQGYCIAVFAAGFVTRESTVRDNLCIDNALSPRLAAMQGALYLSSWNGGVIEGLSIENNAILYDSPVRSSAAIVDEADTRGGPVLFSGNHIQSAAPLFYRTNAQFAPSKNIYAYTGEGSPRFTLGDRRNVSLTELEAAGVEAGSVLAKEPAQQPAVNRVRLEADLDFALDTDGLLAPAPRAQLMVLRNLALEYGPAAVAVSVHLHVANNASADDVDNAIQDIEAGPIRFDRRGKGDGSLRLFSASGSLLHEWRGFQNAATLGGYVRSQVGAPHYPFLTPSSISERKP